VGVKCGLSLRKAHRLRVFENRVLRKIFGPKRDEVTGEWRRLHDEELRDEYFIFLKAQQPPVGQDLIIEGSHSHSDELHSVGLLWASDQPDTETST
jgi:hypothetical protein